MDETFEQATMRKLRKQDAEIKRLQRENAGLREIIQRMQEAAQERQRDSWADAMEYYRRSRPKPYCLNVSR